MRRSEIRGVDIENPYMNVMTALTVPDIDDVTVVDYDAQEERIYWADVKTQTLKRAFINGTQLETIISAGGCASHGRAYVNAKPKYTLNIATWSFSCPSS